PTRPARAVQPRSRSPVDRHSTASTAHYGRTVFRAARRALANEHLRCGILLAMRYAYLGPEGTFTEAAVASLPEARSGGHGQAGGGRVPVGGGGRGGGARGRRRRGGGPGRELRRGHCHRHNR